MTHPAEWCCTGSHYVGRWGVLWRGGRGPYGSRDWILPAGPSLWRAPTWPEPQSN